jgi:hypothetical protein
VELGATPTRERCRLRRDARSVKYCEARHGGAFNPTQQRKLLVTAGRSAASRRGHRPGAAYVEAGRDSDLKPATFVVVSGVFCGSATLGIRPRPPPTSRPGLGRIGTRTRRSGVNLMDAISQRDAI